MKIVFDARIHLNYYSGISRYIICLLGAYARLFPQDKIIVLLNPSIQKDNSIYNHLSGFKNLSFKTVKAGHMGPQNYYKMGRIIKRLAPDVYHYPHLDAPVFTGKIPVVATIHDINSKGKIKKFDDPTGLKNFYFKKAIRMTLNRAQRILFVSDSVKNEVLNQFNAEKHHDKCVRIYNGLEADFNSIESVDVEKIRQDLGINQPYLFYVGQIREHKNIRRIIAAFEKFHSTHKAYKLVIVGHNYLNLDLSADHIQQIDRVDNDTLKALYEGAEALLFPSLFEGFGFPILEAFSFGKPVITTNYGATAEISGGLTELVDPLDVEDILKGMLAALDSKVNPINRIEHTKNFTWENHVRDLRKIYLKLITNASK